MRRRVKRMEKADKPSTRLIDLFLAFARVGMLTFGGGVAMLPMLERECVQRFGWVNNDELTDYFAIGQCTPGIIAVNTATFVGSKQRGALGAAVATLGVISPSIVIILIIAAVLNGFADNPYVIHAFAGIRAAVCALMGNLLFVGQLRLPLLWLGAVAMTAMLAMLCQLPPKKRKYRRK